MFRIRLSFLRAITKVGRKVAGNERAEAALWFLMKVIRATDLEKWGLEVELTRSDHRNNWK